MAVKVTVGTQKAVRLVVGGAWLGREGREGRGGCAAWLAGSRALVTVLRAVQPPSPSEGEGSRERVMRARSPAGAMRVHADELVMLASVRCWAGVTRHPLYNLSLRGRDGDAGGSLRRWDVGGGLAGWNGAVRRQVAPEGTGWRGLGQREVALENAGRSVSIFSHGELEICYCVGQQIHIIAR